MYAVIRAGGKQYRVAPGDVIRVESQGNGSDGKIEFGDVLAVSGGEGQIGKPQSEARVVGEVLGQGRARKVLVFHYKRKKQYKKLAGHRQPFTSVRIIEIAFDGQKFTAPELPRKQATPSREAEEAETREKQEASSEALESTPRKKASRQKPAARKKSAARKPTDAKKKK